ncbi:MAG: hypothetical protein ISR51_07340 [Rhodospirillales bacterium]|nr:hypothetical protein [Alphaproteobacteria bacterium]MBL6948475.1 hypothetical protein [Rhodospirillales bacterium]
MQILFYLGWVLLALAFAAGAAESVPRMLAQDDGRWFISAYDLWYAAWPGKLVVTQIKVERISPALWDPILTGLLSLPAWLLLGLPGGALAWLCRPHKDMPAELALDLKQQTETFDLYDRLAQEARDAGYDNGPDPQFPDFSEFAGSEDSIAPENENGLLEEEDEGSEEKNTGTP